MHGTDRHSKRLVAISWAAAVALLSALVLTSTSAIAQESAPQTLDDLFQLFDVGSVTADFVIVVDTSGSMSDGADPLYPGVRDAYASLIDSIPNGDFVAVVTFDSEPTLQFNDALAPSNRDDARAALPEEAEGQATDIGAALEASLKRLERPDSSDVQTLIFLTDGEHQPPAGSKYPTQTGPEWLELRQRADTVGATHDLTVFAIALAAETDIELVRSVFSETEINNLSPTQLPAFFEESVRRSQVARLRVLVNEELASGSVRTSGSTTATLESVVSSTLTLTSSFTKLPVTVFVDDITATDGDGNVVPISLDSSPETTIRPGEVTEIGFTIRPQVALPRLTVPETTESLRFFVELDARYLAEPSATLSRITSEPLTGSVFGSSTVTTSRTFGWTFLRAVTVALVTLVSLVVLAALYRRFIQVPRISGVFQLDGPGVPTDARLKLKGKRMMLDATNVPGAGSARVRLYTRRGHRGHIYADVERPTLKVVLSRTQERVIPDTTEIRFGTYRMGTCRMKYRDTTD